MKRTFKSLGHIDPKDESSLETFISYPERLTELAKDKLRNKYFYDKEENRVRNRQDDRDKIDNMLLNSGQDFAECTANHIIRTLTGYSDSRKELSLEGTKVLQSNWEKIEDNFPYYNPNLVVAKNYLSEQININEKKELARKSVESRKTIMDDLNNANSKVSEERANNIIKNLKEYSDSKKNLSREGYQTLASNWRNIQEKVLIDNDFRKAREYLIGQSKILGYSSLAQTPKTRTQSTNSQSEKGKPGLLEKITSGVNSRLSRFVPSFLYRNREATV